MTKKCRIVFFGNERLWSGVSAEQPLCFSALIDAGYEIVALITKYTEPKSRKARPLAIAELATKHDIPVLTPRTKSELADMVQSLDADLGVLVAFGMIVPDQVLQHFPLGIINLHPSLLPQFRGPTPIEAAIMGDVHQTGVSLMQLSSAMDAGAVYAQVAVPLTGTETKDQLGHQLHHLGRQLLIEQLPKIITRELQPKPQDETAATFCPMITKSDGEIDWSRPAEELERQIRAYSGWPQSRTDLKGQTVIVTTAHLGTEKTATGQINLNEQISIGTSTVNLIIDRLKPAGRGEMSAADFLNGLISRN